MNWELLADFLVISVMACFVHRIIHPDPYVTEDPSFWERAWARRKGLSSDEGENRVS